jgi:hypothetical protein
MLITTTKIVLNEEELINSIKEYLIHSHGLDENYVNGMKITFDRTETQRQIGSGGMAGYVVEYSYFATAEDNNTIRKKNNV